MFIRGITRSVRSFPQKLDRSAFSGYFRRSSTSRCLPSGLLALVVRDNVLKCFVVTLGISVFASCSPSGKRFDPQAPDVVPSALPTMPSQTSSFRLPVSVPISTVQAVLEEELPTSASGSENDVIWEIDLSWKARRGPITLAGASNCLDLAADVSGSAMFELDVFTLTTITETMNLSGRLMARSDPVLDSGWRLDPNLSGRVTFQQAEFDIRGFTLSARGEVGPRVNRLVDCTVRL